VKMGAKSGQRKELSRHQLRLEMQMTSESNVARFSIDRDKVALRRGCYEVIAKTGVKASPR